MNIKFIFFIFLVVLRTSFADKGKKKFDVSQKHKKAHQQIFRKNSNVANKIKKNVDISQKHKKAHKQNFRKNSNEANKNKKKFDVSQKHKQAHEKILRKNTDWGQYVADGYKGKDWGGEYKDKDWGGEYKDKDWGGKYNGKSGGSACIGGDNLLWDCNTKQTILARDVQIGDSIRVALGGTDTNDDSTTSTCSDVYYVFHHEETDAAIKFTIEDGSTFAVSYNHLVYVVGASFEDRRSVLSQDVLVGDKLVTNGSSDSGVNVIDIQHTADIEWVNVLTIDSSLELQTGVNGIHVVISTHSYDESKYSMIFAPVKHMYLTFGATAVEYMKPIFDSINDNIVMGSPRGMLLRGLSHDQMMA